MKLYVKLLKILFFKNKDTKWVILVAAFVITMISLLMASATSIEQSYSQAINQTAQYDFAIDCHEDMLEKYNKMEYWEGTVSSMACGTVSFDMDIEDSPFYFNCTGLSGEYAKLYTLDLIEGRYPENENDIVVDSKFIDNSDNYSVGSDITLLSYLYDSEGNILDKKEITYNICGVIKTQQDTSIETNAFFTVDGAKRAFFDASELGYRLFITASNQNEASITEALSHIPDEDREEINIEINQSRVNVMNENNDDTVMFVNMFRVIGVFITLVASSVLYNMLQISVAGNYKPIGIIRSLGIRKKQIIAGYGINLLLHCAFSMIVGFIMTVLLEKTIGNFLFDRFMGGFLVSEYMDFSWHFSINSYLISSALVALIFSFVYIQVVIKSMRMTPLEEIRGMNEVNAKIKPVNNQKKIKKINVIKFLGERNIPRNKGKTFYTAFSFFISALLILTIFTVSVNFDLYDIESLKKSNKYDYEYYFLDDEHFITAETFEIISQLGSVESVSWGRRGVYEFWTNSDNVSTNNEIVETRVYDDDLMEFVCENNDIDYAKYKDAEVFMLLGDKEPCILTLYDEDGNKKEIEISEILQSDLSCDERGQDICIIMNEKAADYLWGDNFDYNVLLVKAKSSDCEADIETILEENDLDMLHVDLKSNSNDATAQLRSIICIFIYLMICIMIMTIINMICNVSINVQQRKKEYGVLISLGMTNKNIVRLIISEMMIILESVLVFASLFAGCFSAVLISSVAQNINWVKAILIILAGDVILYLTTYGICYFVGAKLCSKETRDLIYNE